MLPVSRLVRVDVNLSPQAAAQRNFGVLLIMGNSDVINGQERYRTYGSIDEVATDFGTEAPEYEAALLFYSQVPQPKTLMIGRWIQANSAGLNIGGILTPTQQSLSNWTSITNGGFTITIDGGSAQHLTGLDFSSAPTLNAVASIINTDLTGATIAWDGEKFTVTSESTGASSSVSYATAPGSGTDISSMLKLTSVAHADLVPGYVAETPVAAVAIMADLTTLWYGLMFASSVQPTDDQSIAVSAFIEALDIKRIYGSTIIDPSVLDSEVTDDLASRQKAAGYLRSFCQYSSTAAYAIASFFGRAFSVDFSGQNTTINMMYKQEPGVIGEDLPTSQADVLQNKRCNVFVDYVNDTVILQYGVMSGPAYFDEIFGLDWLQDAVQNACYNLLYQSPTKIPQTDAGVNQFVNAINGIFGQAVNNGLVAPGVWNSPVEFGELTTGQYLKTGYYIYAQPVALQSQADRETRAAPPIQAAIKLAGAINTVDVVINVNR